MTMLNRMTDEDTKQLKEDALEYRLRLSSDEKLILAERKLAYVCLHCGGELDRDVRAWYKKWGQLCEVCYLSSDEETLQSYTPYCRCGSCFMAYPGLDPDNCDKKRSIEDERISVAKKFKNRILEKMLRWCRKN